jgi:hypothetical protein
MSPDPRLIDTLAAHVAVRVQAERLISCYIEPNSDRTAIGNELIILFDRPAKREAQGLAAMALGDASARGV